MNISMPPGDWQSLRPELIGLHLRGLLLLIIVTIACARSSGRGLLVVSCIVSLSATALIYLATVHARDIPIDWITVLQHGLERKNIMHLYARGAHAGANFGFVLSLAAGGGEPTLHH